MPVFSNPVRPRKSKADEIYPYYAGFSEAFVADAIKWLAVEPDRALLDPWLGAGTTTRVARSLKVGSIGFDLNPVMVLVAKAELLDRSDGLVLRPLTRKIVDFSKTIASEQSSSPLDVFLKRSTADSVRALALAIWLHLVDSELPKSTDKELHKIAPLPSVFLVGLFNVVRSLLAPLATTNPTWIKTPAVPGQRVSASSRHVHEFFIQEMERLSCLIASRPSRLGMEVDARIAVGDSRNLPIDKASVDAVLTSPPYCTRLDYGRSTMPELLVLESIGLACYQDLRAKLIGASITRRQDFSQLNPLWGDSCKRLLEQIYNHPSKASKNYYFSSHYSYFNDMAASVSEISRVLSLGGHACVVVQDSYYKEIHNDLPKIVTEIAYATGMNKVGEFLYEKKRSMCRINSASSVYRAQRTPAEVALLFRKG